MKDKITSVKQKLDAAIAQLCVVSWMFSKKPGVYFSRDRKLPFLKMISSILSMGAVVQQYHIPIQCITAGGMDATGDRATQRCGSVGGQTGCGYRLHTVFPAVGIRFVLLIQQSLAPHLDVLDAAIIQRMQISTQVGEGKVLTADPIGGGSLGRACQIIVVHGTKFPSVYGQIDHVGTVRA